MYSLMTSQGDLESGGLTTMEGSSYSLPVTKKGEMTLLRGPGGSLNCKGSVSHTNENNVIAFPTFKQSSKCENGKEDFVVVFDKRNPGEQSKKASLKKASKPPRPPKGPLLSASDIKLVKRLTELAARRRARIERMKASRKMKQVKPTSLRTNLNAFIISVVFFVIIIFQVTGGRLRF